MIDTIFFAFNAILPIILVIALGYILKRLNFFDKSFIKKTDRFIFLVALPLLLFTNMYNIESIDQIDWPLVLYGAGMVIILFLLVMVSTILFTPDRRQRGSVMQAAYRANYAIIGIPLATMLAKQNVIDQTVAMATILGLVGIPLFNTLAIISLSIFIKNEDGSKISTLQVVKKIFTNPLIIGILIGFLFVLFRPYVNFSLKNDLPGLYKGIDWVSKIASPLALIILGADFSFEAVSGMKNQIIHGVIWRSLITPILGLGLAYFLTKQGVFNFTNIHFPALVALFGSPMAVSSVVMARQMGNDEELAGQLVVWTSILSILVIFISVILLRSAGLI